VMGSHGYSYSGQRQASQYDFARAASCIVPCPLAQKQLKPLSARRSTPSARYCATPLVGCDRRGRAPIRRYPTSRLLVLRACVAVHLFARRRIAMVVAIRAFRGGIPGATLN
jgi:hypothetical protein